METSYVKQSHEIYTPERSRLGDPEALFSDSGQIVLLLTS